MRLIVLIVVILAGTVGVILLVRKESRSSPANLPAVIDTLPAWPPAYPWPQAPILDPDQFTRIPVRSIESGSTEYRKVEEAIEVIERAWPQYAEELRGALAHKKLGLFEITSNSLNGLALLTRQDNLLCAGIAIRLRTHSAHTQDADLFRTPAEIAATLVHEWTHIRQPIHDILMGTFYSVHSMAHGGNPKVYFCREAWAYQNMLEFISDLSSCESSELPEEAEWRGVLGRFKLMYEHCERRRPDSDYSIDNRERPSTWGEGYDWLYPGPHLPEGGFR